jgi:ATP-dependent DNA ligase
MPTLTLPWYPPAPAAGPEALLQLPPDDWALEPKIDGIRVIWLDGRPYTRHGNLLTTGKGATRLTEILARIANTLDGEWVPAWDAFFAFDLPDNLADYDERRSALARLLGLADGDAALEPPPVGKVAVPALATSIAGVRLVASLTAGRFRQVYASLKTHGAEGVVLKRRRSSYPKQTRPGVECRDWLKRRFRWD